MIRLIQHFKTTAFTAAICLFTISLFNGCASRKPTEAPKNKPFSVILLIGDGMGLTQISTLHQEQDNLSAFSRFTDIGLINTSSKSHKITDSAAGATAFASGVKTYNGAIGVNSDSMPVKTILEIFSEKGYSTGLVATSSITHATPAAFYAHTNARENHDEIAEQLLKSNVNFFAGGGNQFIKPLMKSKYANKWIIDTSDFLQFHFEIDSAKSYGYVLAQDGMPKASEGRGSFCADASRLGMELLTKNHKGFFMMIEGSQIDWGGHANDYEYVKTEMTDFNDVLNMVLDFAEKDGNTLVVVTADHETGGLALVPATTKDAAGKSHSDYDQIVGKFNTGGHSATLIPVFAYGPGSESFKGIYQNTGIYDRILKLIP